MLIPGEADDRVSDEALARYIRSQAWQDQALSRDALLAQWERRDDRRTVKGLFEALGTLHAETAGKSRIGEKSPHHCHHVERIRRIFPAAKFIHIHRDPRDVIASRLSVPWTHSSHLYLAREWARIMERQMGHAERLGPDTHLTLRYESLVAEPEAQVRRLCEFLGESYEVEMLQFHERAQAGFSDRERAWKERTRQPLTDTSIGRYQRDLSTRQIAGIERTIGRQLLEAGGYAPDPGAGSVPTSARLAWPVFNLLDRLRDAQRKLVRSVRKRFGSHG